MIRPNSPDDEYSEKERQLIRAVAERKGRAWADDHAELILAQARLVGEYDPERVLSAVDRSDK